MIQNVVLVLVIGVTLEEKAPNSVGTMVDVGLDQVCSFYLFSFFFPNTEIKEDN